MNCQAEPTTTPPTVRSLDTIISEARVLLKTSATPRRINATADAVCRVLDLHRESGMARPEFACRIGVSDATLYCWSLGQTSSAKDWPALVSAQAAQKARETAAAIAGGYTYPPTFEITPRSGPVKPNLPPAAGVVDLMEAAARRLESIKPPVVGSSPIDLAFREEVAKAEAAGLVVEGASPVITVVNPGIELARELTRARLSDLDIALRKDQERRQMEADMTRLTAACPNARLSGPALVAAREEIRAIPGWHTE